MQSDIKQQLEEIFRTSSSSDELFDSFRIAIANKINDQELYKVLLRNKALSADEISMFTEKICSVFPDISYNIFFCVGQLFESISSYAKYHDRAFKYFKKAADVSTAAYEPYLAIAKMYNTELDTPKFESVILAVEEGLKKVEMKSHLCFGLADLYKGAGKKEIEQAYQKMGEEYQREGR